MQYHFLRYEEFKECKLHDIKIAEDVKGFQGAVEKACHVFGVDIFFPEQKKTLKGEVNLNAIFPPLDMALMDISRSRFKQFKNSTLIP